MNLTVWNIKLLLFSIYLIIVVLSQRSESLLACRVPDLDAVILIINHDTQWEVVDSDCCYRVSSIDVLVENELFDQ